MLGVHAAEPSNVSWTMVRQLLGPGDPGRYVPTQMKHLMLFSLTVMVVGCTDSEVGIESSAIEFDFPVPHLETPAQVENALRNAINSDRAIVFVHMDWAIMQPQRDFFTRFMLRYHQRLPDRSVGFHYVDCTPITSDYTPLKSLPGWPGSGRDIYARQGTGGWGDVIWIDHGIVQHVETIVESDDVDELIAKTNTFFATKKAHIKSVNGRARRCRS